MKRKEKQRLSVTQKKLCRAVKESVVNNAERLKNIRENESDSISGGMYELIHTENAYYDKKYGFKVV